jgi:NADH:ubiquinone oxidoreductase subunit D
MRQAGSRSRAVEYGQAAMYGGWPENVSAIIGSLDIVFGGIDR